MVNILLITLIACIFWGAVEVLTILGISCLISGTINYFKEKHNEH